MNTLEEVNNIQNLPDSYMRKLFISKDRSTVERIKKLGDDICRNKLPDRYINCALNTFKKGFVYYKDTNIVGFAVWKEKTYDPISKSKEIRPPIPYMELLLICTLPNDYKISPKIMLDIDNYCIEHKLQYITLQPANANLIDFYNKYGYIINSTRFQHLKMDREIKPFQFTRTKKTRRRPRKNVKRGTIEHYNTLLNPLLQHESSYKALDVWYNNQQ